MISWGPLRPSRVRVGGLLHPGEEGKAGWLQSLQEVAKGRTTYNSTQVGSWGRWQGHAWAFPSPPMFFQKVLSSRSALPNSKEK